MGAGNGGRSILKYYRDMSASCNEHTFVGSLLVVRLLLFGISLCPHRVIVCTFLGPCRVIIESSLVHSFFIGLLLRTHWVLDGSSFSLHPIIIESLFGPHWVVTVSSSGLHWTLIWSSLNPHWILIGSSLVSNSVPVGSLFGPHLVFILGTHWVAMVLHLIFIVSSLGSHWILI